MATTTPGAGLPWLQQWDQAAKAAMVQDGGLPLCQPPLSVSFAHFVSLATCVALPGAGRKTVHYTFPSGDQMVEEYEQKTDLLVCWSKQQTTKK